jgi:hypothetical protein
MANEVGILAFGSLISEPGAEIAEATVRIAKDILTPFRVEFARRSGVTRAGAPTLVPVLDGGSPMKARLLVLNVSSDEAKDRLWRRETRKTEGHYVHRPNPGPNTLVIETYSNVGGVAVVLAARFPSNIDPLLPAELARLAIESAKQLDNGLDGISYLLNAKRDGVSTPLMPAYEAEILRRTGTSNLEEALASVRLARDAKAGG